MPPAKSSFDRIQEDLRPFADPGTTITWGEGNRAATAEWESRGRKLTAVFSESNRGAITVAFQGAALTYAQFLSHTAVADLLGLAKMIHQAYQPELYVNTKALLKGDQAPQPAVDLITNTLTGDRTDASTAVLFVTGDAGSGKTSVLKELVRTQAQRYLRGETATLYLYVDAQGRALARFDEALAIELQDLRASLTYSALPTLARNGLLVPVVDGFDELLGVTGYDDAFASLRRFIDDLAGSGEIVASARSTYYEQEFLQRATAVPQSWALVPLTVLQWADEEFNEYLDLRFESEVAPRVSQQEFTRQVRACFSDAAGRDLRGKPFFAAKAADLVLEGKTIAAGGMLIEHLVTAYVERDRTEKLVDPGGAPLLQRDQIEGLLVFLAEEMWLQETRELDLTSVREATDVFLSGERLPDSTRGRVIQRMAKSAFLMTGATPNRVQFEHETFLSYFLAAAAVPTLHKGPEATRSFLLRGILPPMCADFAVARLAPVMAAESLLETLGAACDTTLQRGARVRENAGALAVAVLRSRAIARNAPGTPLSFRGFVFAGESFSGVELSGGWFERVEFRRVDFSDARIVGAEARATLFFEVVIDLQSTRLEIAGVDVLSGVVGLHVRDGDQVRQLYAMVDVRQALQRIGIGVVGADLPARPVNPNVVKLVEGVMQAFERSNVIWPGDARHARMTARPEWAVVKRCVSTIVRQPLLAFSESPQGPRPARAA